MLKITPAERTWLMRMRALTTDRQGREVFVGLTHDESIFYWDYINGVKNKAVDTEVEAERYLKLYDRHEAARLATLSAERESREDRTLRH